MSIAHQRFGNVEPIRLTKHPHDLAAIAVGIDHVDEHLSIADELDERRARAVAVRLIFLGRVDVLQSNVDIPALRRPHDKAIAVEYFSDRAREVTVIRLGSSEQQQAQARQ
ncbi:MAG TPA: hypothetical protein VGD45_18030 [Steroidobacter sp.]